MAEPVEIANAIAATESKDVFMAHLFDTTTFNLMDQPVPIFGPVLQIRLQRLLFVLRFRKTMHAPGDKGNMASRRKLS
jgi:hypothetical protein